MAFPSGDFEVEWREDPTIVDLHQGKKPREAGLYS